MHSVATGITRNDTTDAAAGTTGSDSGLQEGVQKKSHLTFRNTCGQSTNVLDPLSCKTTWKIQMWRINLCPLHSLLSPPEVSDVEWLAA